MPAYDSLRYMKAESRIKPLEVNRSEVASFTARQQDVNRIAEGLQAAADVLRGFRSGATPVLRGDGIDVVTAADLAVDRTLRELLCRSGEGWLSEHSADDLGRLETDRVWIVDPLDGTQEFVAGIPEWAVSIGLTESGRAIAGGISNPETGECVLGSDETGVIFNGQPAGVRETTDLERMLVLASRSEVRRGDWNRYSSAPFQIQGVGSVAYKLARVAAGFADATWTLTPKHEWDVAAGVALVNAAGGCTFTLDGKPPIFNNRNPLFKGMIAVSGSASAALQPYWSTDAR
jgi:myo-inositol-1(or 4)-monophosphatase